MNLPLTTGLIMSVSVGIALAGAPSPGQPDGEGPKSLDYATEILTSVDSATVVLSPGYFRAIQAVVAYREQQKTPALTVSERDLMTFNIHVVGNTDELRHESWLTPQERRDCHLIVFVARPRPGERVLLHRRAAAGRTAKYAVNKTTYKVEKVALVD